MAPTEPESKCPEWDMSDHSEFLISCQCAGLANSSRSRLEVLIDWVALKIEHGDDDIPSIDGVSIYATR